jgi:hypothetical protein
MKNRFTFFIVVGSFTAGAGRQGLGSAILIRVNSASGEFAPL